MKGRKKIRRKSQVKNGRRINLGGKINERRRMKMKKIKKRKDMKVIGRKKEEGKL